MKQTIPVLVSLDTNEAHRSRAKRIRSAISNDDHFSLVNPGNHPFDISFQWEEKIIYIELKDFNNCQSDYVTSIINQNGHIYQQILEGRELQDPLIIIVLGDDIDVVQAIAKTVLSRGFRGQEVEDKIAEYTNMVEDFEANCIGLHIPVWRLKVDPWRRMLLNVRKILQGGDLTGFRPRPAERERRAVGLSILCGKGVGPARARGILEKFDVSLIPKESNTYLDDCPGIGPKLATVIQNALNIQPVYMTRPKARKIKATDRTIYKEQGVFIR